jgi:uncharacterized protein
MTPRSVDPRSGLVFDVHELGRRPGALREISRQVPAPEGFGNDMIGVPPGSPIDLDVRLEAVVEGVLVTGVARVPMRGECARCLREISYTEEIDLQELFIFPEKELDDEDASRVEGELIDLEPLLRDSVVLDAPFIPLCSPDCLGICPVCGADLNEDPEHGHEDEIDPRWADLAGWVDDNESTTGSQEP